MKIAHQVARLYPHALLFIIVKHAALCHLFSLAAGSVRGSGGRPMSVYLQANRLCIDGQKQRSH